MPAATLKALDHTSITDLCNHLTHPEGVINFLSIIFSTRACGIKVMIPHQPCPTIFNLVMMDRYNRSQLKISLSIRAVMAWLLRFRLLDESRSDSVAKRPERPWRLAWTLHKPHTRRVSSFLGIHLRQRHGMLNLMLISPQPVFLHFFPSYSWTKILERLPSMPKVSLEMQMLPSGKLQEFIAKVLFLDLNIAFIFGLRSRYDPFQNFFPIYFRLLFSRHR